MIRDGLGAVGVIVAAFVAVAAVFAAEAWLVMLLLGALHHEVSDSVPAVGYGGALLLTAALGLIASAFRSARS